MIYWSIQSFDELSARALYDLLRMRNEVFVVEQACAYQDLDGKDFAALHLCAYEKGELIAYCRLLPPGLSYPSASIGRVLTKLSHRNQKLGRELMERAIQFIKEQYKTETIEISAQAYLQDFYASLGFQTTSLPYLEDNIPHLHMQLG